jgi:hypothetical protein
MADGGPLTPNPIIFRSQRGEKVFKNKSSFDKFYTNGICIIVDPGHPSFMKVMMMLKKGFYF